jgi:hypothetical protein
MGYGITNLNTPTGMIYNALVGLHEYSDKEIDVGVFAGERIADMSAPKGQITVDGYFFGAVLRGRLPRNCVGKIVTSYTVLLIPVVILHEVGHLLAVKAPFGVGWGDGGYFWKVEKFLLPTKILSGNTPHPPN